MLKPLAMAAIASLAFVPLFAGGAQAAGPQGGQDPLEWCLLSGGEDIPQPPGSAIQACCTADGCIICAADWSDCTFDPAYNARPGAGRPTFEGADTMAPPSQSTSRNGAPTTLLVVPMMQAN